MKTIEINFRQPHIDRFIEIMATAKNMGFKFKFSIIGIENVKKYHSYMIQLNDSLINNPSYKESDYVINIDDYNFKRLFDKFESIDTVKARIMMYKPKDINKISDGAKSLLENASDKLSLTIDQIQAAINLASVIARTEDCDTIEAHYMAEAIQYLNYKREE